MHMKGLTLSAILEQGATRRRKSPPKEECPKKQKRDSWRKIAAVLNKCETKRTAEDLRLLESEPEVVKQILERRKRNVEYKERVLETEDEPEVIERKALKLAQAIAKANHLIVYTGAGISTSAKIPDYRGSKGIWTLLEQGKDIGEYDLSLADPTFTHMALFELHQRGILKHVLSQNCDGLHLRSGLPRFSLSEVHGNMYVEVCKQCKPNVEYWRLFDTTQFTARHYHKTNRRCRRCGGPLIDTIVHFGERGQLKWPLNWAGVTPHTEKTDLILCIGSSLKVLRKYTWLWATDRPIKKRPKIFIINLQWTPKDKVSTLKINGRCDEVMRLVMKHLNIGVPVYDRFKDPIFAHATLLHPDEQHTASQPMLKKAAATKEESTTENGIKKEPPADSASEIKIKPPDFVGTSAQQLYLNNLLHAQQQQQMTNNYNMLLNSVARAPTVLPPLVPCSNLPAIVNDQLKVECNDSTESAKPRSAAPLNIIKIDTASNLFGNIRHVLNSINLSSLGGGCASSGSGSAISPQDKYKRILTYCKAAMQQQTSTVNSGHNLPQWYDVNYAYSGLHSIIHPPPPDVNLWGGSSIKFEPQQPLVVECKFCFENYSKYSCQFYPPQPAEFSVKSVHRTKVVICECCDFSDGECEKPNAEPIGVGDEQIPPASTSKDPAIPMMEEQNRKTLESTDGSNDSEGIPVTKRPKSEPTTDGDLLVTPINTTNVLSTPHKPKVKPGWYGKGYRKHLRRKKRTSQG
ncbi:AGAP001220-PA-like protein [Anopheles sinensis]|uniref:protein acetyllysine N-acetyltransferase n=1 Tax=Anopheles sinensis TaxID=74873 RepID=A0A084W025_ANOSI|nr:AGAP001220-PA-like protein [Anopheles sinensis]